jgi:predicted permease
MGFADTRKLAAVWLTDPGHGQQQVELSYADWRSWRSERRVAEVALASSVNLDFTLYSGDVPEHVDGTTVTGNFFAVLGAKAWAGRLLTEDDDRAGSPLRVVLAYRLWQRQFGADYAIIGRQIRLRNGVATVVGIARPEFDFPRDVSLWAALRAAWPEVEQNATLGVFRSVARLAPTISIEQARTRLDAALRQSDGERPVGSPRLGTLVKPIRDEAYGTARPAVAMLLGAVLLLLLIACANAANLTLALHGERRHDMALRAALGAGNRHLVALLLAESVTTALAGGLGGLLLARTSLAAFARVAPPGMPAFDRIGLSWPIVLFGFALTALTVLLFGLGPALLSANAGRSDLIAGLGTRWGGGRPQRRARGLLISAEVSLSVILAIGAGLLARSFARLASIDSGFRPESVLTFRVTTELPDQVSRRALYTGILDRLRSLPGVESAGAILLRPLSGAVGWDTKYAIEGQSPADSKANPNGNYEAISPGYFRTMGVRLLAGRDFDAADTEDAPGAVIINESTAKRHWPEGRAVGARLRLGDPARASWLTVVGVVSDVRYREWESFRPDFYVPYTQRAQHRSDFVVKAHGNPRSLAQAVRHAVFAADRNQPVSNLTTMNDLVEAALARARVTATLIGSLALCAAGLAEMGIYGLLSYIVRMRIREIAIRAALGAGPFALARMVLADILRFVGAGIAVGIVGAAAISRALRAQFYDVHPLEPHTYVLAVAALVLLAVAASVAPAFRAASIDPASAIRS